jgi:hypothetical protein
MPSEHEGSKKDFSQVYAKLAEGVEITKKLQHTSVKLDMIVHR